LNQNVALISLEGLARAEESESLPTGPEPVFLFLYFPVPPTVVLATCPANARGFFILGANVLEPSQSAIAEAVRDTGLGYLWLIVLAIWGGTASYLSRIKRDKISFSMIELMGEWAISGFAGIVTSYVCYSLGWDFYLTAACTGVAGHMGGRAIYLLEKYVSKKFGL
jgi:hypothetical protein